MHLHTARIPFLRTADLLIQAHFVAWTHKVSLVIKASSSTLLHHSIQHAPYHLHNKPLGRGKSPPNLPRRNLPLQPIRLWLSSNAYSTIPHSHQSDNGLESHRLYRVKRCTTTIYPLPESYRVNPTITNRPRARLPSASCP